jgi:hypothetical protein
MAACLHSRTDDRENRRVVSGQQVHGDGADGRRAKFRDVGSAENCEERAGRGIEENNRCEMGRHIESRIAVEYGNDLCAKHRRLSHERRHDRESRVRANGQHRSHRLDDLPR